MIDKQATTTSSDTGSKFIKLPKTEPDFSGVTNQLIISNEQLQQDLDAACRLVDELTAKVKEQAAKIRALRLNNKLLEIDNARNRQFEIKNSEQAAEIRRLNRMIDEMAKAGALCQSCPIDMGFKGCKNRVDGVKNREQCVIDYKSYFAEKVEP